MPEMLIVPHICCLPTRTGIHDERKGSQDTETLLIRSRRLKDLLTLESAHLLTY